MSNDEKRVPEDALANHPLRDTQEFESDIRSREGKDDVKDADPNTKTSSAVGGLGGALAGAGLGTVVAGPVGAIVGAIAGSVGGWWAGRAASDAGAAITTNDDATYQSLYEQSPHRTADRSYEDVRHFYHLGHIAGDCPDYGDCTFEQVEADLQKGWTDDLRMKYGDWAQARPFAREAFTRRRLPTHDSALRDSPRDPAVTAERARGRSASALDGLRRDDTVGY
ncbi:MAG: hypothetical protein ACT4PJ_03185 [Gemmatimonadaceae bacterium]